MGQRGQLPLSDQIFTPDLILPPPPPNWNLVSSKMFSKLRKETRVFHVKKIYQTLLSLIKQSINQIIPKMKRPQSNFANTRVGMGGIGVLWGCGRGSHNTVQIELNPKLLNSSMQLNPSCYWTPHATWPHLTNPRVTESVCNWDLFAKNSQIS
jgi:hypothetical protein